MELGYDMEALREDLMNYLGTAMENGFPMAVIELSEIENASNEEVLQIALHYGINLEQYMNQ